MVRVGSPAARPQVPAQQPPPRGLPGGVRARIVLLFVVLLVTSTAASLLVLREVLLARIGNEVQRSLASQVESLRALAGADTAAGRDFDGDLARIFDAYLARERPPQDGVLATYIDGDLHGARVDEPEVEPLLDAAAKLAGSPVPAGGELASPAGDARYVAVPIRSADREGVLVAARLLAGERDRVEGAVAIAGGVGVVVTLLASIFIWLAAGRAVQPLRALARATRSISETDLSQRVAVRGGGEIGELGRTFNDMLDRLELAFADQKDFLADVGHELRTPITVIRGHLETLGDDPAERREATAVIHEELERMSRLVDDLLLLARADRPDFLMPQPLDLDLLTHELVGKARTLGVRRWAIDEVGVGLVRADPHRLTSAVMNLAQNAVRHTRGDDTIAIGSSLAGGEARIWVRDEGEGIPPDKQERIFERFASDAERSRAGGGAGLGLAIVKAIAEAHGGHVELQSAPGAGARFTIVFPSGEAPTEAGPWPGS